MTSKLLYVVLAGLLVALPQPVGRVNDFAGILDAAARQEIDSLLATLEHDTTAEVAVATVTSLEGLTVEEYAARLFQEWGIGQKGADNGVLLVVAPAAREMRIEVGYGLEGVIPDGLAGQIIREDFLPHFRSDDYRTGILQGVRRVVDVVRRNHTLSAQERLALDEPARPSHDWVFVLFMSFFVAIGAFVLGLGFGNRIFFLVLWGTIFGGVGFALSVTLARWALWTHGSLAVTTALLGFWIGRNTGGYIRPGAKKRKGWVLGTSSTRSSGSSGSSGSSRSSSGGSFGGGRSGGGGASGRW